MNDMHDPVKIKIVTFDQRRSASLFPDLHVLESVRMKELGSIVA
jgi:hypothetical protein